MCDFPHRRASKRSGPGASLLEMASRQMWPMLFLLLCSRSRCTCAIDALGDEVLGSISPEPPPLSRHVRRVGGSPANPALMAPMEDTTLAAEPNATAISLESVESSACMSRVRLSSISACDFENTQVLEWSYGDGDSGDACGDEFLPEPFTVKCDHVAWWSGEGVAIMVLAAAGLSACMFFWLGLSRYRNSRTVRLGQPAFCMAFVVGVAISCLASLALLGENTDFSCALRLWVWSAGFDLAFGAMALKLWRALSVAENSLKFRKMAMTNRRVHGVLVILLMADAVTLISWTVARGCGPCGTGPWAQCKVPVHEGEPPLASNETLIRFVCDGWLQRMWHVSRRRGRHRSWYHEEAAGESVPRSSCVSCCDSLFFVWVGLKVAIVLFCCFVSYRTRKIRACMADSGAIALATYNMCMAGLLVAAVFWADANPQVRITSEAVAIVLVAVGALCTILAPKLVVAKEELENKALIGSCSGPCSSDAERDLSGTFSVSRLRVRAGRVGSAGGASAGGASATGSVACIGEGLITGHDCEAGGGDVAVGDGRTISGVFAIIPGSTDRKKTPVRGAAAPVVPVNMLGTPAVGGRIGTPSSRGRAQSSSVGQRTPVLTSKSNGNEEVSAGGGGESGRGATGDSEGGESKRVAKRGRQTSGSSVYSTPPPHMRRSQSASADVGGKSQTSLGESLSVEELKDNEKDSRPPSGKDGALYATAPLLGEQPISDSKPSTRSTGERSRGAIRGPFGKVLSRKSSGTGRSVRQRSEPGVAAKDGDPLTPVATSTGATEQTRRVQAPPLKSHRKLDSWYLDPITLALNGDHDALYRGGGTGESGSTTGSAATQESRQSKQSRQARNLASGVLGITKRTLNRRASSGSVRSARWRDRERTVSSVSSGSKPSGVKRGAAAGSLKMFADCGTRLFCPHCEQEVAGCGFKGCSGSLVRAPSFSDDEGTTLRRRGSPPMPIPPLHRALSSMTAKEGYAGGKAVVGEGSQPRPNGSGTIISRSVASLSGGSAATTAAASSTGSTVGASGVASPLPRSNRLSMNFRRGRSACDTFDNEEDSTDDDERRRATRSAEAVATPSRTWTVST